MAGIKHGIASALLLLNDNLFSVREIALLYKENKNNEKDH
jgi:hypothetical protein